MNTMFIWIDDLRRPPSTYDSQRTVWAKTYRGAVALLETFCNRENLRVILDLDHDLGQAKSGYDVCKYVVENHLPLAGFRIHSMNPVGRDNMIQLMTHYGYKLV